MSQWSQFAVYPNRVFNNNKIKIHKNMENPEGVRKYSPEQEGSLENDRTVSDAELIKGGARWKLDEATGEKKNLEITEDQAINMKMEREGGIVDNLGTYIRMNKVIMLPLNSKEVGEQKGLKEVLEQSKGKVWMETYASGFECIFVDKDGNVAKFFVDENGSGIKSLSKEARTIRFGGTKTIYTEIGRQLKELGFKYQEQGNYLDHRISVASEKYQKAIEKEQEDSKDNGFSF
jgi:hypothetical protein